MSVLAIAVTRKNPKELLKALLLKTSIILAASFLERLFPLPPVRYAMLC